MFFYSSLKSFAQLGPRGHTEFNISKRAYLVAYGLFFLTLRLTSFVMKVFCKANEFDGVNIDENMVCESVDWLIQNQRGDGALPEVNAVIHREIVVRTTELHTPSCLPVTRSIIVHF